MRQIVCLLVMLVGLVWLASILPATAIQPRSSVIEPEWRRTAHGWQRATAWTSGQDDGSSALHPAVVGGLEALLSLTALLAFSSSFTGSGRSLR